MYVYIYICMCAACICISDSVSRSLSLSLCLAPSLSLTDLCCCMVISALFWHVVHICPPRKTLFLFKCSVQPA